MYTTIEQSQKLKELGLPSSTADMIYVTPIRKYPEVMIKNHQYNKGAIPCWSTEALFQLLPYYIKENNTLYWCEIGRANNTITLCNSRAEPQSIFTATGDSLLESLFKTMCKLLDNTYYISLMKRIDWNIEVL